MDVKVLRETARKQMTGKCRVCPVCNGRVCAGEVPGMGGTGTGEAFTENMDNFYIYIKSLLYLLQGLDGGTKPSAT